MLSVCGGTELGPVAVCSNGAIGWDVETAEVLFHQVLSAEAAAEILAQVRREMPGVLFALEALNHFVYEVGMLEPEDAARWGIVEPPVEDLAAHLACGVTKLCCWHPELDGPEMAAAVVAIAGEPGAEVTSAGAGWALVGPPGSTKAAGLALACERLGVEAEAVAVIGDEHNDLPMLAWAGWAVAVGNGRPEVLAAADEIVKPNTDDGPAGFIEGVVADIRRHRDRDPLDIP